MEEVKKEQIDIEDPLKLPLEKNVKKEIFEPSTANTHDEIVICEPKIEETYSENENEDFYDEEEDFPLKKRYKSHKIKPTVDGIYICEETGCMYQTTVRRNLRRHNLARHSDAPNNGVKFDCHICDAKLASKGSLFNHVKHVHERQKNFKCDLCERYFAAKQQMQQHISSFHEGNKPFHCEICQDMRWATRGGLVEHMASVHEGKTYDCELCDATFKSKGGLRGHHTTVHDTTNAFRCEICGATFAQRNGLKLHIQGIHEGNKPHSCKICDYSTTQRSTLKQHIQTTHVEGKDAQLWRYDDENEMLENHKGKWNGRKDIKSYIPKEGEEGNIENDYCHVLGLEDGKTASGTRVKFEPTEYTTLTDDHMWLRGKADKNGYFTFKNRTSGLFLTAVNPFRTTIENRFRLGPEETEANDEN